MEPCTGAKSTFVVKAFYKNGESFVMAQRDFRREFGIHPNCAVLSAQYHQDLGSKLRDYWFYTKEERW